MGWKNITSEQPIRVNYYCHGCGQRFPGLKEERQATCPNCREYAYPEVNPDKK